MQAQGEQRSAGDGEHTGDDTAGDPDRVAALDVVAAPDTPPTDAGAETGTPETEPEPGSEAAAVPARRSKRKVDGVLGKLSSTMKACGKKGGLLPGEKVDVSIVIGPDGKASKVDISGSHAAAGESCMKRAIKRALRARPALAERRAPLHDVAKRSVPDPDHRQSQGRASRRRCPERPHARHDDHGLRHGNAGLDPQRACCQQCP